MWEVDEIVLDKERQKLDIHKISHGYFVNIDDFEVRRQKTSTPDELAYFQSASSYFDGIRPYLLRQNPDKQSRFHLTFEIGRGGMDAAMAFINAGADDFNSVSQTKESPSVLLGALFYEEKKDFDDYCDTTLKQAAELYTDRLQSSKTKRAVHLTREEGLRTAMNFPSQSDRIKLYNRINYLNDFIYIYSKLKNSSKGLNQEIIDQYAETHPNFHVKEGLSMMEELLQVSERERFLPKKEEDKKKKSLFGSLFFKKNSGR